MTPGERKRGRGLYSGKLGHAKEKNVSSVGELRSWGRGGKGKGKSAYQTDEEYLLNRSEGNTTVRRGGRKLLSSEMRNKTP